MVSSFAYAGSGPALAFLAVCDGVLDDVGHVMVGQGVDRFAPGPGCRDQIDPPEQPQMLGDQGLRQLRRLSQCAYGRGLVGKRGQDEKPRGGGQGFEQLCRPGKGLLVWTHIKI